MRGIPIILGHFANFPTLETPDPQPIERKQFIDNGKLYKQTNTNRLKKKTQSRPLCGRKYHLAVIMTLQNKTSRRWI